MCSEGRLVSGSSAECEQIPIELWLDARLLSLERLRTSGIDLSAQHASDTWKFRFDATYLLSYRGVDPGGAVLEELNTINNPVDLRARATAARAFGPLTILPHQSNARDSSLDLERHDQLHE